MSTALILFNRLPLTVPCFGTKNPVFVGEGVIVTVDFARSSLNVMFIPASALSFAFVSFFHAILAILYICVVSWCFAHPCSFEFQLVFTVRACRLLHLSQSILVCTSSRQP